MELKGWTMGMEGGPWQCDLGVSRVKPSSAPFVG